MKIALLLSGTLKQFLYKHPSCAELWSEACKLHNIDVFAVTEDNDYFYNDVQYFSDKETKIKVTNNNEWRIYQNVNFISYEESYTIITKILQETFGDRLKDYQINPYSGTECYYDSNDVNHKKFMELNTGRSHEHKLALLAQYFKLKRCYELMQNYETIHEFSYNIVIRSRFDISLINLKDIDFNGLLPALKDTLS